MSTPIANVNHISDTFEHWLEKTNQALYALSTTVVTSSANATGGTTTGNVHVDGILSANVLTAVSAIRGGSVDVPSDLLIETSGILTLGGQRTDITSNTLNVQSNVVSVNGAVTISGAILYLNSDNISIGNNNTLRVRNDQNRVGVNTTTPDASLSVVGTANISGNTSFSSRVVFNANTVSIANVYIKLDNTNAGHLVFGNTNNNRIGFDGTKYHITGAPVGFDSNIILNANVTTTASNASIIVNRGTGNTSIKWNELAQRWIYTNDGNNFLQFASNNDVTILTNDVSNLQYQVALRAPIESPALTGTPTAPTAVYGANTTQIATTAFVQAAMQAIYPVGSIYINASDNTNPADLFGFGTWIEYGGGRVLVGQTSLDASFDQIGETGGSKDAALVSHTHQAAVSDPGHTHAQQTPREFRGTRFTDASGQDTWEGYGFFGDRTASSNTGVSVINSIEGVSAANANLPPYVVVKMWRRTA